MKSCDLQAVSIDPTALSVKVGDYVGIVTNMKNNGPDPLPVNGSRVHITVTGVFVDPPTLFKPVAGGKWSCQMISSANGLYEFYVTNIEEVPLNEQGAGFEFQLKAVSPGKVHVTLASSLSANVQASDPDGANQSVDTEFDVVS